MNFQKYGSLYGGITMNKEAEFLKNTLCMSLSLNLAMISFDNANIGTGVTMIKREVIPLINKLLRESKRISKEQLSSYHEDSLDSVQRNIISLEEAINDEDFLSRAKGMKSLLERIKKALIELRNNLTK